MKLPEMAALLIRLIGREPALQMMAPTAYGGKLYLVPKSETGHGEESFAALAETIGADNAKVVSQHFGGERIYVPLLDDFRRVDRNREIVTAYDAGVEVWELSSRYAMSERQIRNILKQTDMGQNIDALIEAAQGTLF
jgi:hypothetical protein